MRDNSIQHVNYVILVVIPYTSCHLSPLPLTLDFDVTSTPLWAQVGLQLLCILKIRQMSTDFLHNICHFTKLSRGEI